MDEPNDLAKIVFTAVGTLSVGLIVGLVTWTVQARRENSKWVREKRFELYTEISDLVSSVWIEPSKFGVTAEMMGKDKMEAVDSMMVGYQKMHALVSRLAFVGPKSITTIGTALVIAADSVKGEQGSSEREESTKRFSEASAAFNSEAARILRF